MMVVAEGAEFEYQVLNNRALENLNKMKGSSPE